ncbi:MAG: DUF881 domain-containing protein [Actinomycetota bacterium]|nr:DUF881 domain-containing protein [Actinomycetota bacterium]
MASPVSRAAVPLAAALLGFLAVLAASEPRQAPPRASARVRLVDLIVEQDERVRALRREVRDLNRELTEVGAAAGATDDRVRELRSQAEELAATAGTTALRGPGVVVTLDDSSASRSPTGDLNDLIIHEGDIQTAVNSLWASGAEAVAINGERLTATSAVRCAGNTLLLHGALHSPPYRIAAIGDPSALGAGLSEAPGVERLVSASELFGIRYSVETGSVAIPARPPVELRRAHPVA